MIPLNQKTLRMRSRIINTSVIYVSLDIFNFPFEIIYATHEGYLIRWSVSSSIKNKHIMFSTRTIINILDDPAETVSSVKYLNRSGLVA